MVEEIKINPITRVRNHLLSLKKIILIKTNVDFMCEMVPTIGHNEINGLSTDFNQYVQSPTFKLLKLLI